MRITVFTSNQPRHIALIEELSRVADEVFAVQECSTVFPGRVGDFFRKSPVMQDYFSRVMAAEEKVFGRPRFLPRNVRSLSLKMGDLSDLELAAMEAGRSSDLFVVFGSSYIKGALCERLVERGAINIHMGISPQYRGSSCNFWALYDRRPDLVGATLHRLSRGLDSGAMLRHALPPADAEDGFLLGMLAVRSAHRALVDWVASGRAGEVEPVTQDRTKQIRYTRNADFTDEVAAEYLGRLASTEELTSLLAARRTTDFLRPFVG